MSTMVPVLLSLLLVVGPAVAQDTQNSELGTKGWVWRRMQGNGVDARLTDFWGVGLPAGNHTMEEKYGCKVQNNNYCGAFWTVAYDGRDYIKLDTEIPAWIPLQPEALKTKVKWETEGSVHRAKAALEEDCTGKLQRYLQFSRPFLDRQDPPSVSITSHMDQGNIRTFKCVADNFYPKPISMYWTQADSVVETESWGEGPLSENGTYQSWVVVKIPSSDRGPYSCHVQHSSLAQPLTVTWNKSQ
ncbi:zinc-alpha-2-glycoprotein-like [Myotis lucifugus]|uniref:zinc-alpha-2-glycoprotein-like n=1 Tax=Myotis lucifugus TaxID=59463 RepID=UPI000CCBDFA2|nr:zinc-alpha-2-glycoprotein-like [Myotis lucifugus]